MNGIFGHAFAQPAGAGGRTECGRPDFSPAGGRDQCAITTGTVMASSMPRVAPPTTNSRKRLWP